MSVLGLGTDIVAVARLRALLERHGDRFLARCFQEREQAQLRERKGGALAAAVAGHWGAKEAFLKALGGSIAHIPYRDIVVLNDDTGAPRLAVSDEAARTLQERGGRRLHVTISHERDFAVATVLIED